MFSSLRVEKCTNTGVSMDSRSFNAYLREILHTPTLSIEEEEELIVAAQERGDVSAIRKLVVSHMKLVAKIALLVRSKTGLPVSFVEDFIQEGALELYRAIPGFKFGRGARFATYVTNYVRNAISEYLDQQYIVLKHANTAQGKRAARNLGKEKHKRNIWGPLTEEQVL